MKNQMLKVSFFCLVASFYVCASPVGRDFQKLDKKHAEDYCHEILANICGSHFRNSYDRTMITARVMNHLSGSRWWWDAMTWTPQEVYEATMGGLLDYVEEHTFSLAKKETGDCEVTNRITENVRNELLYKMSYASEFKSGSLQEYVGSGLESKVRHLSCHYLPHWQRITHRYDSIACCGCNVRFVHGLEWTYLNCGHNVCITCADRLSRGKNSRCPKCGWPINSVALGRKLHAPSAPRFD